MSAKEFINDAFFKAEKINFPYLFTESKELANIYNNFLDKYKEFKRNMLSVSQIKQIEPFKAEINDGDFSPGEPELVYDLSAYNLSTQRFKNNFEDFIFSISQKSTLNGSNLDTLIVLKSKALDFYHEILEEIENSNNNKEVSEDKKTILEEPDDYEKVSLKTNILGNDFKIFKDITKQENIVVCGCAPVTYIQDWISKFNENSKIAMEAIGYQQKDITLNNNCSFYISNSLRFGTTKAHIAYSSGNHKEKYEISYSIKAKVNIASSLLHEWFHALDLENGYKHYKKNQKYASWDFLMANTSNESSDEWKDTFKKGLELASSIYGDTTHEKYQEELINKISDFKKEIPEIIGTYLAPDINNGWSTLSFNQKNKIIQSKPFQESIPLTLSYQTSSDAVFVKNVGKILKQILKEPAFLEAFPSEKSEKLTSRINAIKEAVKAYSLERQLGWSHKTTEIKNYSEDGYTLLKSDFAVFSHFKSQFKSEDYLFLPHEMFARKVQSLCQDYVVYKNLTRPLNGNAEDNEKFSTNQKRILNKSIYSPETSFCQRLQIIDTVQAMGKFIGMNPSVKPTEAKGLLSNVDLAKAKAIDAKIQDRKSLSKNNLFMSEYKTKSFQNLKKHKIAIISSYEAQKDKENNKTQKTDKKNKIS